MKRFIQILLVALAFGLGGAFTAQAEDLWEEDDVAAFDSDNWAEDEYGWYDEDFVYEAKGEEWDGWFDEQAYADWMNYDTDPDEDWWFED